ncbi:MAG: hypothetical protein HZB11_03360 [Candidatus Yonathbacteria bacterium]|nr:hypothetical protein [Candidatus Yonathbacteria bacterium]
MPKHKEYKLKEYEKVVAILAAQKGFTIKTHFHSGSAVRFELFVGKEEKPRKVWVIHTSHKKTRNVLSREDYRKPDLNLGVEPGTFLATLETI